MPQREYSNPLRIITSDPINCGYVNLKWLRILSMINIIRFELTECCFLVAFVQIQNHIVYHVIVDLMPLQIQAKMILCWA